MAKLILEGKKIQLKEFDDSNLYDPKYHEWLRDLDVISMIYRMEYLMPIQFSKIEEYVKTMYQSNQDCFFAIYEKETDSFIGTAKLGHINWRSGVCDLGIIIGDSGSRGKGYSKEAAILACNYAFYILSLRKVTGGTYSNNFAMIKCFLHVGFIQEGQKRRELLVKGEFLDHLLFGLFRDEFKPEFLK
ncbi:MAG: GNAT family protein [Bacteroidia bacterium]|nr:GNAT family protein [Bacteroidia bacterium]